MPCYQFLCPVSELQLSRHGKARGQLDRAPIGPRLDGLDGLKVLDVSVLLP